MTPYDFPVWILEELERLRGWSGKQRVVENFIRIEAPVYPLQRPDVKEEQSPVVIPLYDDP